MDKELMEKTQEILSIKNDASSLIIGADTLDELNRVKLDFLGKSGFTLFNS